MRVANSPSGDSVVERVVRVLASFDDGRTAQTAAQIARRAGLPRTTAYRLVDELLGQGLLDRGEDGLLRIGLHLWELTTRGSRALRLRQAAMPAMRRVQDRVREHTQLGVLEQREVLFLERLSDPDAVSNVTRIAGRLPLHASSSGLVLLAHAPRELQEEVLGGPLPALTAATITDPGELRRRLAAIRRTGHAEAPSAVETVSTGIAVPVRADPRRSSPVVAALGVVVPRDAAARRLALEEIVAQLQSAAEEVARGLAHDPSR